MNVDDFKRFAIWCILITYSGFVGVYVLLLKNDMETVDFVMLAVCVAIVIGFIEIAVRGYKKSMEGLSRKIRGLPMNRLGVGANE